MAAHMIRFDVRYLGSALLIPCFETFRRVSFSLPVALAQTASPIACMACEALGAGITAIALFSIARWGRCLSLWAKGLVSVAVTALLGCLGATVLFEAAHGGMATILSYGTFALVGCALTVLAVGWAQAYGRIKGPQVFGVLAVTTWLGSLPKIWLVQDPSPVAMGIVLIVALP